MSHNPPHLGVSKKKKKKKKKPHKVLLSFGGDDEEEEQVAFQIKKSNTSAVTFEKKRKKKKRRKANGIAAGRGDETTYGDRAYLQRSSGMYTAEALQALKKNTIHFKSKSDTPAAHSDEAKNPVESSGDPTGVAAMDEDEEGGVDGMPSKEEIIAARRRREMMRAMGTQSETAPEYIPLNRGRDDRKGEGKLVVQDSGAMPGEPKGLYGHDEDDEHGGLLTEQPDDMEEDVFDDNKGRRILLHDPGKPRGKIDDDAKQEIRNVNKEDEDDEYQRWIDGQIKKGGARVAKAPGSGMQMISDGTVRVGKRYVPSMERRSYDAEAEMQRVESALSSLKENYGKGERDMNQLDREIKDSEMEHSKFESDLKLLNKQYMFYQTLRDKVSDCLACLNVKSPLIDEAMNEMKSIQTSRAKAVRRLVDLHTRDMHEEAFGKVESKEEEPQIDEFGREIRAEFEQGREKREKIREERRRLFKERDSMEEGFWTDDEAEIGEQYNVRHRGLLQDVERIFRDADDEFKSLDTVKAKLEQLKRDYQQAYENTYISLSVPSLFAPYVRVELLEWKFREQPQLSAMRWYMVLSEYGLFGNIKEDDPDLDVIPKIVENVVTPYITDYLFTAWNPLSARQFESASRLVREVLDHVDGKLQKPQKMLSTVLDRFHNLINLHHKYAITPNVDDKGHKQWEFCQLQYWKALKILRQLIKWRGLLSEDVIKTICGSHIGDNLLPFLSKEMRTLPVQTKTALHFATELLNSLPEEWKAKAGVYGKIYNTIKAYFKLCQQQNVGSDSLAKIKSLVR